MPLDSPDPLPERLCCLDCGYDLRGSASLRCPECGETFTREDIECRRTYSLATVREFELHGSILCLGVIAEAVLATVVIGQDFTLFYLIFAVILSVTCLAIGYTASLFAPKAFGLTRPAIWARTQLWVALPWLTVPPLAMLRMFVNPWIVAVFYLLLVLPASFTLFLNQLTHQLERAAVYRAGNSMPWRFATPYLVAAVICLTLVGWGGTRLLTAVMPDI